MKFKWHYFFECVFIIPIMLIMIYLTYDLKYIPIGIIAIVWGTMYSDADLRFGKEYHRYWLYHSIIVPIVFIILSWNYIDLQVLSVFLAYGTGVHCACDTHLLKYKMRGTYTIKIWKNVLTGKIHGLNGLNSTIWLWSNFWISVILLIITCVWVV